VTRREEKEGERGKKGRSRDVARASRWKLNFHVESSRETRSVLRSREYATSRAGFHEEDEEREREAAGASDRKVDVQTESFGKLERIIMIRETRDSPNAGTLSLLRRLYEI